MTAIQDFKATMAEAAAPLKERLTEIDTLLTELRSEKQEIEAILRKADQLPRKEQSKKPQALSVSEDTVARVLDWLQTLNGDEFHASGLIAREDFDVTSSAQLSKALNVLHERGQITLHRMGKGGSKHYKVVA